MNPVTVIRGSGPIVLGQPHSGTYVPDEIWRHLNELGRGLQDTDWHVPQLYDGLLDGATIVRANFNRYVIDANRDPSGTSLYPGQNTTELVPTSTFDGVDIWHDRPSDADISDRLERFHSPYHKALTAEIARVKAEHGCAVLYDCHSIRSKIPRLFDDQLPDLNIGDNCGVTCSRALTAAIDSECAKQSAYSHVTNGRFIGGWTTRHYGNPKNGIHAVQMELAQRQYLACEKPPFNYDERKAEPLRDILRNILEKIQHIAQSGLLTET